MRILIFILLLDTFASCSGQKSKPPDTIKITVPSSVSTRTADDKSFLINLTKDGKVYLLLNDVDHKDSILNSINKSKGLNLSDVEIYKLKKMEFIGLPLNKLKETLNLGESVPASKMDGIPVNDSTNELTYWIKAISECFKGEDINNLNFLIKADTVAQYSTLKKVEQAFTENHIYKFKLVTIPQ